MGRIWKVATGDLLTVLDRQSMALRGVAFAPDGLTVAATGISDNDVRLWVLTEETRDGRWGPVSGTETEAGTRLLPGAVRLSGMW